MDLGRSMGGIIDSLNLIAQSLIIVFRNWIVALGFELLIISLHER
jgi:hypothetical protein